MMQGQSVCYMVSCHAGQVSWQVAYVILHDAQVSLQVAQVSFHIAWLGFHGTQVIFLHPALHF